MWDANIALIWVENLLVQIYGVKKELIRSQDLCSGHYFRTINRQSLISSTFKLNYLKFRNLMINCNKHQ